MSLIGQRTSSLGYWFLVFVFQINILSQIADFVKHKKIPQPDNKIQDWGWLRATKVATQQNTWVIPLFTQRKCR
jgi:hypothetical protein